MPILRIAQPFALLLAVCLALFGAGCSSPSSRQADPQAALQKFNASAYAPPRADIRTRREAWSNGGTVLETVLTAPTATGAPLPLVIYLPGMGEGADGGALWREHWAHAGYAVMSFQLAGSGPELWSGLQARAGDFRSLSRDQFAPSALRARVDALRFVLDEMARRHDAGAAPFAGVDTSHPALAGYDLGAQAAAAALSTPALRGRFGAVLLIGQVMPPARNAAAGPWPVAADVTAPAMTVTGTDDHDPYEFGSGPHTRQSAWMEWPAGGKYLLMLEGSSHALLSGQGVQDPNAPVPYLAPLSSSSDTNGGGRGRGKRSQGNPTQARGSEGPRELLDLRQIAAVQSVTLAFLDASLANKAPARQWLERDSREWLGKSGELSLR